MLAGIAAAHVLAMGPWLAGPAGAASITVSGDARVRYESVEIDPGRDIHRKRYRARGGLDVELADDLSFHLRLATGDGSPVSTNLNFGESVSLDDINLDRAYFDWQMTDSSHLYAGKMKNPLYRPGDTSLSWDGDWNPEGIAAALEHDAVFGSVGVFRLADQGVVDSLLFSLQAGRHWTVAGGELTAGLSYYDYSHARGRKPFFRGITAGNSVDAEGNYLFDYDVIEVFADYALRVRNVPVEFFGDWLRNLETGRENRAWAVGVNVGQAEQRGQFSASWAWHHTDADAVIGIFTDSDFGGGVTDSRGQVLSVQYALTDRLTAGSTLILSEFGGFSAPHRDYDRLMLDVEIRF